MKTKVLTVVVASFMLFSCSKSKFISSQINNEVQNAPIVSLNEKEASKEAEVEYLNSTEPNAVAEASSTQSVHYAKESLTSSPTRVLSEKEQKMKDKIEKRVEKIQKKQETKKGGISDRMKIGIVLAAVGLILIVLGGLGLIFYLLGVIAFIIGAVLILIELLEM